MTPWTIFWHFSPLYFLCSRQFVNLWSGKHNL